MNNVAIKFRPSLTLDEIHTILSHVPATTAYSGLRRKLEVFTLKAQHGITAASHVAIGRQSLESQLGLEEDHRIESLLHLYESRPSALSAAQLKQVQFHRFQQDMMSPEEEAQYLDGSTISR